jgi:hypothetical protein
MYPEGIGIPIRNGMWNCRDNLACRMLLRHLARWAFSGMLRKAESEMALPLYCPLGHGEKPSPSGEAEVFEVRGASYSPSPWGP